MLDLLIQESNNKISTLSTSRYAFHESFFTESLDLISAIRKSQVDVLRKFYSSISEECKDNAYGKINDHFLEFFSGYSELINTSAKQMSGIIDTAVKDLQVKIKESSRIRSNNTKTIPMYETIKPGIRGNIVNVFENAFTNIETKSCNTTDMVSMVNEIFIVESANREATLTAFRTNLCESEFDVDMTSFGRELFLSLSNGNTSPRYMTSVTEADAILAEAVIDCQNMKNALNRDCKALIESVSAMLESIDTNGLYAADKYRVPGSNTTKFGQDAIAKMNMLVKLKLEESFTCMNYQIMAIGAKLDVYSEQTIYESTMAMETIF